jgi:hypothetical protein
VVLIAPLKTIEFREVKSAYSFLEFQVSADWVGHSDFPVKI